MPVGCSAPGNDTGGRGCHGPYMDAPSVTPVQSGVMTAPPPQAAAAAADAIVRTLGSPEWMLALGADDERGWILLEALCEHLHPLGAVQFPSVHRLREAVDRPGRDRAIREEFDGTNYLQLARRHRLSTRQVRRIVDGPRRPAVGSQDR